MKNTYRKKFGKKNKIKKKAMNWKANENESLFGKFLKERNLVYVIVEKK